MPQHIFGRLLYRAVELVFYSITGVFNSLNCCLCLSIRLQKAVPYRSQSYIRECKPFKNIISFCIGHSNGDLPDCRYAAAYCSFTTDSKPVLLADSFDINAFDISVDISVVRLCASLGNTSVNTSPRKTLKKCDLRGDFCIKQL